VATLLDSGALPSAGVKADVGCSHWTDVEVQCLPQPLANSVLTRNKIQNSLQGFQQNEANELECCRTHPKP